MPHLTKIRPLSQPVECEKKERRQFDPSKIEPPPYEVYMDSTSGKLEPAYGNRASIPPPEHWPEGTLERVRAAQAPEPKGVSKGSPSFGKSPGSRRSKHYNTQAKTSESADSSEPSQTSDESKNIEITQSVEVGGVDDAQSDTEEDEYVVYQTEKENLTGYDLDKHIGNPHPFINPETARTIENIRSSDDLWWNWRQSERWSRWQRPRPNSDTVMFWTCNNFVLAVIKMVLLFFVDYTQLQHSITKPMICEAKNYQITSTLILVGQLAEHIISVVRFLS